MGRLNMLRKTPAEDDLGLGTKAGPHRGVNKDGTFSQTIYARTSYRTDEILWGARRPTGRRLGGGLGIDCHFGVAIGEVTIDSRAPFPINLQLRIIAFEAGRPGYICDFCR